MVENEKTEEKMTLDALAERFREIEDLWLIGSPEERQEYLAELAGMTAELRTMTGTDADRAVWLGRTVDRLSRNISSAQDRD